MRLAAADGNRQGHRPTLSSGFAVSARTDLPATSGYRAMRAMMRAPISFCKASVIGTLTRTTIVRSVRTPHSFRRNRSGSLAKFAAMRRASSRVSRFGRRAMRRSQYVRNRGRSGSARPALETTFMTHKRRGALALSSRLSTRFIGSFADKPTESGDSTIVWGRSPASPKRPPCKRRGHYG